MAQLVSVITPTWRRHRALLGLSVPSVQAQTYGRIEHVVVSDGPDTSLPALLPPGVVYAELPEHDPGVRWGLRARLRALELAHGDVIAYLDDDDTWRPGHAERLVAALEEHPDAMFGWTRMAAHLPDGTVALLGDEALTYGRIATSMMFHRRELAAPWQDTELPDWDLAERWLLAGTGYVSVPVVTADYHRSRPVELGRVITR